MDPGEESADVRQLRVELESVRRAWQRAGIDLRSITNALSDWTDPRFLGHVGGWVTAPGTRKRFDEALQKLGDTWTIERLVVDERFRHLFPRRVIEHAQHRLDMQPEP